MSYPEDSIQSLAASWWEACTKADFPQAGCLVRAYLPHVDQVPHTLRAVGRVEAAEHKTATVQIEPLHIGQVNKRPTLPIAALSLYPKEVWTVYRAKTRPCLVVGAQLPSVDNDLRKGMPLQSTSPTLLVAPYYGADKDGNRAGYNAELLQRIKHAEYPQFMLDSLPIDKGPILSVLRFDHIQPVGLHYKFFEHTGFRLSKEAQGYVLNEWLHWLVYGQFPADSLLREFRQEMKRHFSANQ